MTPESEIEGAALWLELDDVSGRIASYLNQIDLLKELKPEKWKADVRRLIWKIEAALDPAWDFRDWGTEMRGRKTLGRDRGFYGPSYSSAQDRMDADTYP